MMNYFPLPLFCIAILLVQSCSDKEEKSPKNKVVNIKSSPPQVEEQGAVENMDLRAAAISNFKSFWIRDADDLDKYSSQLNKFSERLEKIEGINRGKARSEIYLTLTEHQPQQVKTTVKWGFSQVILNDIRGAAIAIGELPSGELRRSSISYFTGTKKNPDEFAELYHAMPESGDRSLIAAKFVSRSYFERGADSALDAIRSLETEEERMNALEALARQMSGASVSGERNIPSEDIVKVRAFAVSSGQGNLVRSFDALSTAKR